MRKIEKKVENMRGQEVCSGLSSHRDSSAKKLA